MKSFKIFLSVLVGLSFLACTKNDDPSFPEPPVYDMSGFAKGADVSWLTEMEAAGTKFYDADGRATECMSLLRDLGVNSIRLRVWVNPEDGWCNKNDVLAKAWRAHKLGLRLMIDFHYSDVWADPGSQSKPAAWSSLSFEDLKSAVSAHTSDVLSALKALGIAPEWVQVGNETGNGMLWDEGKASSNMKQYAELTNSGYDAVKSVFPDTKVIVHLQEGNKNSLYRWLFDGLKENGAKWDVIGMSLYPSAENWESLCADCVSNMNDMVSRYGSDVMLCEVGMNWDQPDVCNSFLSELLAQSRSIAKCLGVFYWEPESYNGWNGYAMGAFDASGKPTTALDAFKN